ncbi:hypothetical protein GCM10009745_63150 [Kribbella yunnanensis]|uniref:GYD domain-containing protein n=1 Tax=Kribbella yunnanensis TaxID=190194 RepID=A0ABN2IKV9_9ACTN
MPRFLWQVTYTPEGSRGLAGEGGSARHEAVRAMFEQAGGRLEAFYYAFGPDDLIVIGELPDNATAAAFALNTNASGTAHSRATVLLTPEELDRAAQLDVAYRPPGQAPTSA